MWELQRFGLAKSQASHFLLFHHVHLHACKTSIRSVSKFGDVDDKRTQQTD